MNNKKSQISKCLIGGGLLALICGIFCFFGSAFTVKITAVTEEMSASATFVFKNLFSFMFGTTVTVSPDMGGAGTANVVGGTTALFVIEMIIIVLAVTTLIGMFAKKLSKKHITISGCAICVLALVAVILAFCSKKMIIDSVGGIEISLDGTKVSYGLGSAGISYGVLGIVGILATGAGLYLGKDETAVAA